LGGSTTGFVPPSGGSLEIGNSYSDASASVSMLTSSSPFGGIPRNWKLDVAVTDI